MVGSELKENMPDSVGSFGIINPHSSAQIHSIQKRYAVKRQLSVAGSILKNPNLNVNEMENLGI